MKDILLICPTCMIFAAGYFVMKKADELLELARRRPAGEKKDEKPRSFWHGFWEEAG